MVLPPRSQTTETLVHTQDIDLRTWIGRSETLRDTFASAPVRALTATLDHAPLPVTHGMPLPPLWHWLYFLPMHRQSEIGPDGHAKRGGFLPPVPLPRRMWAGSQFEFRSPIRVGDRSRARPRSMTSRPRKGRTGKLVFVKVRHEVRCNDAERPGAGRVPRHRLPRGPKSRRRRAASAGRAEPAPPGSARSCPTTCCCSATRRSPSTATASTTTAST